MVFNSSQLFVLILIIYHFTLLFQFLLFKIYFDDKAAAEGNRENGVILTGKDGRFAEMLPKNPNIDTCEFPLLTIFGQQTWRPGIAKHPRLSKKDLRNQQQLVALCEADNSGESSSDVDDDEDGEPIVTTGWRKVWPFFMSSVL